MLPILNPPPSHTIPPGHPSAPAPSIQYGASNLDWHLISYMIFYMFFPHLLITLKYKLFGNYRMNAWPFSFTYYFKVMDWCPSSQHYGPIRLFFFYHYKHKVLCIMHVNYLQWIFFPMIRLLQAWLMWAPLSWFLLVCHGSISYPKISFLSGKRRYLRLNFSISYVYGNSYLCKEIGSFP